MKLKKIIIVNSLFIMFSVNAFGSDKGKNDDIIDLSISHDFYSVGNPYRQHNKILICVENNKNEYGMWDPATDNVFSIDYDCNDLNRIKSDYENLFFKQASPYINTGKFTPMSKPEIIQFLNGNIYYVDEDYGGNCRETISVSWLVDYKDKRKDEFYFAVKRKSPRKALMSEYCDSGEKNNKVVEEYFDVDYVGYHEIQLNDNKSLFYRAYSKKYEITEQPVLLLFKKIPNEIWSSNHNIYVIPKNKLSPLLNKSKDSIEKRYKSLIEIIGNHEKQN